MPYPNYHACRINDPKKYKRIRYVKGDRSHNGKKYDVIYGVRQDGKAEDQAYRYPKGSWQAAEARSHCKSKGGSFEQASKEAKHMEDALDILMTQEDGEIEFMDKRSVPESAMIFSTDALVFGDPQKTEGGTTKVPVTIDLYSGASMNHFFWGKVAIQTSSLKLDKQIVILREHMTEKVLGAGNPKRDGDQVKLAGFLSSRTKDGEEVIGLLEDGVPLQASMGLDLRGAQVIEVREKSSYKVNGRNEKGPITIFENAKLREGSICTFGADSKTRAYLATDNQVELSGFYTFTNDGKEEPIMADDNKSIQFDDTGKEEKGKEEKQAGSPPPAPGSGIDEERARVKKILDACEGDLELAGKLIESGADGEGLYKELFQAQKEKNERERAALASDPLKGKKIEGSDGIRKEGQRSKKDLAEMNDMERLEVYKTDWDKMKTSEREAEYKDDFKIFVHYREAVHKNIVKILKTADPTDLMQH